ncbi:hypothetical protein GA0061102_1002215 [Rhizobium miluonense]|uniref:Uncharacterized protein n=1 Tax=Rhizobium miluonense TaxID=411945 RepID=A0A1C3U9R9_9HYPH|nr:hypothetical protein GA0061102_1002215 [Rhizobium miluonense]
MGEAGSNAQMQDASRKAWNRPTFEMALRCLSRTLRAVRLEPDLPFRAVFPM